MSTLEDLDDLERENKDDKKDEGDKDNKAPSGDAEMKDAAEEKKEEEEDVLDEEILGLSTSDIVARRRLLENDARIMKSEFQRLTHEKASMGDKIKENLEKIENNRYGRHNSMIASEGWLAIYLTESFSNYLISQTVTVPRRQCRRDPRSRCRSRSCRRRRQHRPRRHSSRQIRSHQDLHQTDHLSSAHWSC